MLKKIREWFRWKQWLKANPYLYDIVVDETYYFEIKEIEARQAKKGCDHPNTMYGMQYTATCCPMAARRCRQAYNKMLNLKTPAPKKDLYYETVLKSIADQARRLSL